MKNLHEQGFYCSLISYKESVSHLDLYQSYSDLNPELLDHDFIPDPSGF